MLVCMSDGALLNCCVITYFPLFQINPL